MRHLQKSAWLAVARRRKENKYRELLQARRCRLVVLGVEVGGRWSQEANTFVRLLAKAKARTVPTILSPAAQAVFFHRWTALPSVAAQRAMAATLLELPLDDAEGVDGEPPVLEDVFSDARLIEPPIPSRVV